MAKMGKYWKNRGHGWITMVTEQQISAMIGSKKSISEGELLQFEFD